MLLLSLHVSLSLYFPTFHNILPTVLHVIHLFCTMFLFLEIERGVTGQLALTSNIRVIVSIKSWLSYWGVKRVKKKTLHFLLGKYTLKYYVHS